MSRKYATLRFKAKGLSSSSSSSSSVFRSKSKNDIGMYGNEVNQIGLLEASHFQVVKYFRSDPEKEVTLVIPKKNSLAETIFGEKSIVMHQFVKSKLSMKNKSQLERKIQLHPVFRQCQRVIQLLAYFEDACFFSILMEYAPGNSLSTLLNNGGHLLKRIRSEKLILEFANQLFSTHAEINKLGISLRCVSTNKIFIESSENQNLQIKISCLHPLDSVMVNNANKSQVKRMKFMPLEQLGNKARDNTASDAWSIGMVIYTLIIGRSSFMIHSLPDLKTAIAKFQPDFTERNDAIEVKEQFKYILLKCLERNPGRRPTPTQIIDMLSMAM